MQDLPDWDRHLFDSIRHLLSHKICNTILFNILRSVIVLLPVEVTCRLLICLFWVKIKKEREVSNRWSVRFVPIMWANLTAIWIGIPLLFVALIFWYVIPVSPATKQVGVCEILKWKCDTVHSAGAEQRRLIDRQTLPLGSVSLLDLSQTCSVCSPRCSDSQTEGKL